jgi:signal transduction histidine kinase/ActR/RegA family two-component response regulator
MPREERRNVAALAAALVFLVLASALAVVATIRSAEAERWVAHSVEVRRLNLKIFSTLQSASLGARGYVISHEPVYLEGLGAARGKAPEMLKELAALVSDNPAQVARVRKLKDAVNDTITSLDATVALAAREPPGGINPAAATRLTAVRETSDAIEDAESRLLTVREKRADVERDLLLSAVIASMAAAGALAWFVVRSANRSLQLLEGHNTALASEVEGRMKAEEQLRQAQKMEALGQLTGGVAHDFNNMLAIIMGNLDLMQRRLAKAADGKADATKLMAYVDNALEGSRRAATLTQSLLAFSRQQPLAPRPFCANETVADMSRLLRRTLGESVEIETVLAGGLWPGFIDTAQLESAILNLAVNARDAMPDGGKLTIETANTYLDEVYSATEGGALAPGQYVMVAFTDTGSGMSTDVIDRVFDPFYTTKEPGKGTGLGLSQVHGLLRQSNGHVKIYSEVGVGTTVKLYIPRAVGSLKSGPPPSAVGAAADKANLPETVVLVVEDDAAVRAFVCDAVRALGHQVIEAENAETALTALDSARQIQLILTDVVMPGPSGRALADEARRRRPDVPVVFMTGYTRNAIVHNGVLDRGALLLSKPFTLAQLAAKLKEALAPVEGHA